MDRKEIKERDAYAEPKVLASYLNDELKEMIKPHADTPEGSGGNGCGCGCGCSGGS